MSRDLIIATAAAQDGIKESPASSNRTKYGHWYGLDGVKWCAIFVSWVYDKAGYRLKEINTSKGFHYCQSAYNHWKKSGELTNEPQPGDIVLYDWEGNGHCDHTGIFEKWVDKSKGLFTAWEGNTEKGNDSDGGKVMRRTRSVSAVRGFASPRIIKNPSPGLTESTLKKGSRGADVTVLQKLLYDLGYPIKVDSLFGPATEEVVRQFQKAHFIKSDGMVSPTVLGAMEEELKRRKLPGKIIASGTFLTQGSSGESVVELQDSLNGFKISPKLKVDGVFGEATATALRQFQAAHGLEADGIAGPKTFEALGIKLL